MKEYQVQLVWKFSLYTYNTRLYKLTNEGRKEGRNIFYFKAMKGKVVMVQVLSKNYDSN